MNPKKNAFRFGISIAILLLFLAVAACDDGGDALEAVATTEIRVHATTTYQSVSEVLTLDERAVTARFQLYLTSSTTFWADEMFLRPDC